MELVLEVEGSRDPATDLDSLGRMLRTDEELRSATIENRMAMPVAEGMGPVTDALLIAFGSGGAGVALIELISGWLHSRRSDVRVKVTAGKRTVEIDITSAKDPRQVIALLEAAAAGPRTTPRQ
jgi:hypothetical protein